MKTKNKQTKNNFIGNLRPDGRWPLVSHAPVRYGLVARITSVQPVGPVWIPGIGDEQFFFARLVEWPMYCRWVDSRILWSAQDSFGQTRQASGPPPNSSGHDRKCRIRGRTSACNQNSPSRKLFPVAPVLNVRACYSAEIPSKALIQIYFIVLCESQ